MDNHDNPIRFPTSNATHPRVTAIASEITAITVHLAARDGGDDAVETDPANAVVVGIGQVEGAVRADGQGRRFVELGLAGWSAVAAVAFDVAAGNGAHDPIRADATDSMILRVGDENGAVRRDGNGAWPGQLCLDRGTAIAGRSPRLSSCHNGQSTIRGDAIEPMIQWLQDEDAAVSPQGQRSQTGGREVGLLGVESVVGLCLAASRDGVDDAIRRDPTNATASVRDIDAPVRRERQPTRKANGATELKPPASGIVQVAEARLNSWAAVAQGELGAAAGDGEHALIE